MKKVREEYLNDKIKYDKKQLIGIVSLIIIFSGLFGYVYEFIFYYFNGGMKTFYMQGGNFLPWINIYAIGGIIILILTSKYKRSPFNVFFISLISSLILEFTSGYILNHLFGLRFWNYNNEILNFGNIGGYICFRSVTFFGISGLLLIYFIIPFCIYLSTKFNYKKFMIICLIILSIVLLDEFYNLLICKLFDLPSAIEIYKSLGFKYV